MAQNSLAKPRQEYLDWICGLMILQMIFGHALEIADMNRGGWFVARHVLYFNMQWFFFKGGMFFKDKGVAEIARTSLRRLMVPFFVFSVVGLAFDALYTCISKPEEMGFGYFGDAFANIFTNGFVIGNSALWFLLSLSLVRVFYCKICHSGLLRALCLACCVLIPYAMNIYDCIWQLLGHTLLGMFFFVCGHWLSEVQFNKYVLALSVVTVPVVLLLCPTAVGMSGVTLEYGNWFVYFVYSLAAIIVINNLFRKIPDKWLKKVDLGHIGRNSMTYLVLNMPVLRVCKFAWITLGITGDIQRMLLMAAVSAVALPLFDKLLRHPRLKWMIGS